MKPVSTILAIWILALPIALFVVIFASILVLFWESLDGSSILSTFSALVSTVLVILLVWERLRDSLSEKLKYVFEIWLLSMRRRLRDKRQFFDSQDALRKYKDDLGKYGKFINISLYPKHFLVEINEFLTMHKEFYKRLGSIEKLATDRIGQHDLNRDLLHGLVGLTSCTQARNQKEMKVHEEICKTIRAEKAQIIKETKEYLENLEQNRKALSERLEDFIMTNGLSKKVGGASLVP